jgi:hypothetical protein
LNNVHKSFAGDAHRRFIAPSCHHHHHQRRTRD